METVYDANKEYLKLISCLLIANNNFDQQSALKRITDIENNYGTALQAAKDSALSDKEQKANAEKMTAFGKALPGIYKGIDGAISSFKKEDNIGGVAAIMDICAAVAPLIGSVSAIGGPPGAVVGAIFSVIGMIIGSFAPKPPSVSKTIIDYIDKIEVLHNKQTINVVLDTLNTYCGVLNEASKFISNAPNILSFNTAKDLVKQLNPLEGNTIFEFKRVLEWLKEANFQTLESWPLVLGIACDCWARLQISFKMLKILMHSTEINAAYESGDNDLKTEITSFISALDATIKTIQIQSNTFQNTFRGLIPVAQNRGMLWQRAPSGGNGELWAGTNILQGNIVNFGGEHKRFAVTVSKEDRFKPTYHVFTVETRGRFYYKTIDFPYHEEKDGWIEWDSAVQDLSDVWATPAQTNEYDVSLFTVKVNDIRVYGVQNNTFTLLEQIDANNDVHFIRAVQAPKVLSEDPVLLKNPNILTGVDRIIYGGMLNNKEVFYCRGIADKRMVGYVKTPWDNYDGISVDQHFLWVFKKDAIACVSHASIMECFTRNDSTDTNYRKPNWMSITHYGDPLTDLCSCDDGTLVRVQTYRASRMTEMYGELNVEYFNFLDTTTYEAKFNSQLNLGKWVRIRDITAVQGQKSPVSCWELLAHLAYGDILNLPVKAAL